VATREVSTLESHLGYWLRYVSNHVSQAFAAKVAERGVSVAEWVVLRELYTSPTMPSALADKLGMTRGAITKIVDRLEGKELAARTVSVLDKRAQTLMLTRKGRALVPTLAMLADRNDKEFFGYLDAQERSRLEAVLRDIVQRSALQEVPVQ
jgi:DNA-binding MarR family transcriptional regulator